MQLISSLFLTFTLSFGSADPISNTVIEYHRSYRLNQAESSLNNALVELGEGINPKSFDKSWKTEGPVWVEKVKSATDVATLSSAYLTLAENIKPKFYKPNWEKSKEKWVKQVKEARSNLALAGLLKTFYSNLIPETFTKEWAEKGNQWVESLNKIE